MKRGFDIPIEDHCKLEMLWTGDLHNVLFGVHNSTVSKPTTRL
jgi:hypothetical protein